jgi:DNA-binding transcriptional ArsR family regulator
MTQITWDYGTAYDFFISLHVLHSHSEFGLRAAWAAGMRSRLPADDREFLELAFQVHQLHIPFGFVHGLPAPRDAALVLKTLEAMPAEDRIVALTHEPYEDVPSQQRLMEIRARGSYTPQDVEEYRRLTIDLMKKWDKPIDQRMLDSADRVLHWWASPAEFGERTLAGLRSYYEVFFAEEERRIAPALIQATEEAHELAEKIPLRDLMKELSQGLEFEDLEKNAEVVLVPSYWGTPLVFFSRIGENTMLYAWGARPVGDSLVPGEAVPDSLVRVLKALSDPTRLRILRYLEKEALTPTMLSRHLRLRPPTVLHHLGILRLAGLVYIRLSENNKDRSYAARDQAIDVACGTLKEFLAYADVEE